MPTAPQNEIVSCPNCGLRIRRKKLDRHAQEFCPARVGIAPQHAGDTARVAQPSNQIGGRRPPQKPLQPQPRPVPAKAPLRPQRHERSVQNLKVHPTTPRPAREAFAQRLISDADAESKHRMLRDLAIANDPNRDLAPMREVKTVFRKRYTNPYSGNTLAALDYGHRAFPIEQKGKPSNVMSLERRQKKRDVAKQCEPIESRYRLAGGFAAGDRVRHTKLGYGIILSISPIDTVFRFDATGLHLMETNKAHDHLTKMPGPMASAERRTMQ